MPKKDSDYSNTIIYKISCKDKTVTDLYVGHTINFVQRKISHEQNSKSDKCKLYQIIRTNGGWCNWTMEIIAFFNCMNHTEARMKEQEFFLSLKANLNSLEPFPKQEEKEKNKTIPFTGSHRPTSRPFSSSSAPGCSSALSEGTPRRCWKKNPCAAATTRTRCQKRPGCETARRR